MRDKDVQPLLALRITRFLLVQSGLSKSSVYKHRICITHKSVSVNNVFISVIYACKIKSVKVYN